MLPMKKGILLLLIVFTVIISKAQLTIGMQVPEISLPDTQDSIINLSSFRGKIVLVDFWASWCGPCRAANPGVVKLYKKYQQQGFEVFAVSVDKKKSEWLKAIKKDKITYQQVNDNGGWRVKPWLPIL
jgi:peroxiredoxin